MVSLLWPLTRTQSYSLKPGAQIHKATIGWVQEGGRGQGLWIQDFGFGKEAPIQ